MPFYTVFPTDLVGDLTIACDGDELLGCWFDNDRHFGYGAAGSFTRNDDAPALIKACEWLGRYFDGKRPDPHELVFASNVTAFQMLVRDALLRIPYGTTTTYGEIARDIAERTGKRTSARAVGGAVGRNPLCVIVPCHRVVGADGSLTGFGGGVPRKVALLEHEDVDMSSFTIPAKGTALKGIDNAAAAFISQASRR